MKFLLLLSYSSARREPGARAGLALFGLLLAAPLAAQAQGAEKSTPAKTSEKDYVLVHKSSYVSSGTQRNPFWPIGWVPSAPKVQEAAVVVPTVRAEDFVVTSISLDFPPLAVVNKHTYGVGDRIPVGAATLTAGGEFVTVRQISDGVVVLDHRGALLRCTTNTPTPAVRK